MSKTDYIEAIKLAREAFLELKDDCSGCEYEWNNDYPLQAKALKVLEEALKEVKMWRERHRQQRTWVGLTDEQKYKIAAKFEFDVEDIIKAVEDVQGIKE